MKYYQTTYVNSLSLANSKVNNSKVFNLSLKSQVKPTSVQDRLLRRIIEKRLAQVNHRIGKVIVPEDLEPLIWKKDLDDYQKDCNFAS
jgi:hypothetical protein